VVRTPSPLLSLLTVLLVGVAPFDPGGAAQDAGGGGDELAMRAASLGQAVGFGHGATGGTAGRIYEVTTLDDDAVPGSLRYGAESDDPLWIVFRVSGTIYLDDDITVRPNKTLDGRGQSITIADHGLHIIDTPNVIVTHLKFDEGENDAIHIDGPETHDVWIDHSSLSRYTDGLIDITDQATDITVSWCRFALSDMPMLIGAGSDDDQDVVIRVTLHHSYFDGTRERNPRLRYGKLHAFNNLLHYWTSYGMGASDTGQLASEANIFDAHNDKDAIIDLVGNDYKRGRIRSTGDWLLNGARIISYEPGVVFSPKDYYSYAVDEANDDLRLTLQRETGWRPFPESGWR